MFLVISMGDDAGYNNNSLGTTVSCGFAFCCPSEDNSDQNLKRPPQNRLSEVGYTFIACVVFAGVLVALFLDPVKRVEIEEETEDRRRREATVSTAEREGVWTCQDTPTHVALMRQMSYPYQILLIPLTLFAGMEEAFLHTDYTQAYVACSIGISNLGYVMACYAVASGVGAVVSCVASGYFADGRSSLLVIGATLHGGLVIVLIVWTPNSHYPHSLFVVASLWGLCDALWKTQISVIYEAFFPNDLTTAMVVLWLWESAGYAIGCGLSVPLCTGVKLHTLLAVLLVGLTGYAVVEAWATECCRKKKRVQS